MTQKKFKRNDDGPRNSTGQQRRPGTPDQRPFYLSLRRVSDNGSDQNR